MDKPVENPYSVYNFDTVDRGCTFCSRPIRVQASNCEHPMCRYCYVLNGNQCSPCAERQRLKTINEETICCLPRCKYELSPSMRPHFTCGHKYCCICSTEQHHKKCPKCGGGKRVIPLPMKAKLKNTMDFKLNPRKRRGESPPTEQMPILEKGDIVNIELKEHENQGNWIAEETLRRERHHYPRMENPPESNAGNLSHHSNTQIPYASVSSTTSDVSNTVKRTAGHSKKYDRIVKAHQSKFAYLCLSPRRDLRVKKCDANEQRLEYTLKLQSKDCSNRKNWQCKIVPRKRWKSKSSQQRNFQQHASSSSREQQQTAKKHQVPTSYAETVTRMTDRDSYNYNNEMPTLECYGSKVLHSISSVNDYNVEQSRHVSSSNWLPRAEECSEGERNENTRSYPHATTSHSETIPPVTNSNLLTNQETPETILLKEKKNDMYLPLMPVENCGGSHPLAKTLMCIKVGDNYFPEMLSEHFLGKEARSGLEKWKRVALRVYDALAKQFPPEETLETQIVDEMQCETLNTDQNYPVPNVDDYNNGNINLSPQNLPEASVNINGTIESTKPNCTKKMYIKVETKPPGENSLQVIVKSAEAITITYPENDVADGGKVLLRYISTVPNETVKTNENVHYINMNESCDVQMVHGPELRKAIEEWIINSSPVDGSSLGPNINITHKDGNVIAEAGSTAETFLPFVDFIRLASSLKSASPGEFVSVSKHITTPTILTIYRNAPHCSDLRSTPLDALAPDFKQIILPEFMLGTLYETVKMTVIHPPISTNLNMLADVALLHSTDSTHTAPGNGFDANIASSMEIENTQMEVDVNDFGAEVTIPYLVE